MSVSCNYRSDVTVTETLETNVPAAQAANAKVIHNQFNTNVTLNETSTPAATKHAAFVVTLSSGATIDLAALTGTNGATVNGTGLKLQVLKMRAPAANSGAVTVSVGASDGYDVAGSGFSVELSPGQEFSFEGNDATPDVGASDKEIDFAGTDADTVEVQIVLG